MPVGARNSKQDTEEREERDGAVAEAIAEPVPAEETGAEDQFQGQVGLRNVSGIDPPPPRLP